jgi:thiamine pyrophosphokinase
MKNPIEVLNEPKLLDDLARIQHESFKNTIKTLMDVGAFTKDHEKIMVTYMGDFDSLSSAEQEFHRSQAWKAIQTVAVAFLANSMIPDQYGG